MTLVHDGDPNAPSTLGRRTKRDLAAGTFDDAFSHQWTGGQRLAESRKFARIEHELAVDEGERDLADARRDQLKWLEHRLQEEYTRLSQRPAQELLQVLGTQHAFAWVDIARMIGVSVPAIRKWRHHGGVTPDNAAKLAELAAFATVLEEITPGIRAAAWMSTPLVPGFTVAPADLYSRNRAASLLDIGHGAYPVAKALDDLEPGWRERFADGGVDIADGPEGRVLVMR
jgi:hypothetical protein